MPITVDGREVNLTLYPLDTHPIEPNKQLTLGDLHGNALKLFHYLVYKGVINTTEADLNELKRIYQEVKKFNNKSLRTPSSDKPSPTKLKADLKTFKAICERVTFNLCDKFTSIGDDLADRGANDWLTLLLLDEMFERGPKTDILFSNHGAEFLLPYEKIRAGCASRLQKLIIPKAFEEQTISRDNLQLLIDYGIIKMDDVRPIMEKYIKRVKLISYSVLDNENRIIINTHGVIDEELTVIRGFAKFFGLEFKDASIEELTATIDSINQRFTIMLEQNQLNEFTHFKHYGIGKLSVNEPIDPMEHPFVYLCWSRSIPPQGFNLFGHALRPRGERNYNLTLVNGHTGKPSKPSDPDAKVVRYSVDSEIGRPGKDVGSYEDLTIIGARPEAVASCTATEAAASSPRHDG